MFRKYFVFRSDNRAKLAALMCRTYPLALLAGALVWQLPEARGDETRLTVGNPIILPERLPVVRSGVGTPHDYKPCIAKLPSGELLIVAFRGHGLADGKIREDESLFRSLDEGNTWSDAETLSLPGREPYFSMARDGTLFMTAHLTETDIRNRHGYLHSYLHRSNDGGHTWDSTPLLATDVPGAPASAWTHTSRNVLELSNGDLILGVSTPGGNDFLWRSTDGGKTWDRSLKCVFEGIDPQKLWWPFMAETVFWQARNGDLLGIFRVDPKLVPPLPDTETPEAKTDQSERLIVLRSRDGGEHWTLDKPLGSYYGEMYPAILRLADGRLLLTFTVRAERTPLGVHAVLGKETGDGFEFDFHNDRIVIDAKTPTELSSGGGFGPTVQLSDGSLVTAYSYRGEDSATHLEVARWRLNQ